MMPVVRFIALAVLAAPILVGCAKDDPAPVTPTADSKDASTPPAVAETQAAMPTPAPASKPDLAETRTPPRPEPAVASPTTRTAPTTPVAKPEPAAPADISTMTLETFTTTFEKKVDTYSQKVRGYNMALGLLNDDDLNLIAERFEEAVAGLNEKMTEIYNAVEADDVRGEMQEVADLIAAVSTIDVEFKERLQEIRKRR